jgi:GxxExxY protein
MEKEDITGKVIKAAYEVHNNLKSGFQEVVYQRALAREMRALGLEFKREEKIPVYYKGNKIDSRRVDFVVEDVIVEIKAKSEFEDKDFIQTLAYLKSSGFRVALLLHFGGPKVMIKRFIN